MTYIHSLCLRSGSKSLHLLGKRRTEDSAKECHPSETNHRRAKICHISVGPPKLLWKIFYQKAFWKSWIKNHNHWSCRKTYILYIGDSKFQHRCTLAGVSPKERMSTEYTAKLSPPLVVHLVPFSVHYIQVLCIKWGNKPLNRNDSSSIKENK